MRSIFSIKFLKQFFFLEQEATEILVIEIVGKLTFLTALSGYWDVPERNLFGGEQKMFPRKTIYKSGITARNIHAIEGEGGI